ncbi:DUF6270 domain-containing protein [Ectopseudomonas hydrolytica]|uniref:DUF6270 domain-containing protein n=1 Tax=Ectopseudomonas hydrolytica TaxID=2493633 RepID=UPI003EE0A191
MACEVLIFGSCVSRDIFNFDSAGNFNLVDYYARQSLGSLVGQPYSNDAVLQRISSAFRRRMVARDFAKSILQADSAIARADVILLDLIDERFDLLLLPTGHVLTYSAELAESKFLDEPEGNGYRRLKPGSEERRAYWLEGMERFFSWLQANGKRPAVLVNKVYWSSRIEPEGTAEFAVSQEAIGKANAELDWMYAQLRRWLAADQFMSFAPDSLVADADHRWGVAPFHYVPTYYRAASDQIMRKHEARAAAALRADARDIRSWGVAIESFGSVEEFLAAGCDDDGLCQIELAQGQYLDILLQDFEALRVKGARRILVALSGAVAERKGKMAPFFSGLGIARSLGLPLIAVADPSLALDGELSLGWYAGNESRLDLPFVLADILDSYARRHGVELLVIGGSDGGFAALQLGALLKSPAQMVVWNPQTSISEYSKTHVIQYLRSAFPHLQVELEGQDLYQALQSAGIRHDLRNYPLRDNVRVLYLQNQTDWHIEKHAGPYFAGGDYLRVGRGCWQEREARCVLSVGSWGQGHQAVPKEVLLNILSQLAEGVSQLQVAQGLERDPIFCALGAPGVCWFSAAGKTELSISAKHTQQAVVASACLLIDGDEAIAAMYAFYLLVNGKRHDMRWYGKSSEAVFNLPAIEGKLEVVGFAKDTFGEKLVIKVAVD